jgi:hypothetical protein
MAFSASSTSQNENTSRLRWHNVSLPQPLDFRHGTLSSKTENLTFQRDGICLSFPHM